MGLANARRVSTSLKNARVVLIMQTQISIPTAMDYSRRHRLTGGDLLLVLAHTVEFSFLTTDRPGYKEGGK